MTDNIDFEALARRAVDCKGWRWLPGMLTAEPGMPARLRIAAAWTQGLTLMEVHAYGSRACTLHVESMGGDLPDLRDPATLGCLLALVREAWGDPAAYVAIDGQCFFLRGRGGYLIRANGSRYISEQWSEVEALVTALEAAPR